MGLFTEPVPGESQRFKKEVSLIYLIEMIWTDCMENNPHAAVGYQPFGFTFSEETAKNFCDKGRQYTSKDCWAIMKPMPEYRYKPLKKIS